MKKLWFGLRWQFIIAIAVFTLGMMATVVYIIRGQQTEMLRKEITERGLTLARTLAATSLEQMELPERTLATMLLVKEVIQTSEDPNALKTLTGTSSPVRLLAENLRLGGVSATRMRVNNEGVLYAKVVGSDGKVVANADAIRPQEAWFEDIDKPFVPPAGTVALSGTVETVSESPENNGLYVVAVPIMKPYVPPAPVEAKPKAKGKKGKGKAVEAELAPAPAPSATVLSEAPLYTVLGAVYLGVSKGLVRRAVAHAVARIILIALVLVVVGIGVAFLIARFFVRPIHQLHDAVQAVAGGNYTVRVQTKLRDEIGELAGTFNEMTSGLAEKELIGSAFGAYVSKDVLDEILKNPDAMRVGGARKSVTMVCSDVRGFTAMSEKLTPENVVTVINRYLDVEAKLVADFKGYLDRFVGDAVRAVFGVPMEKPDDAVRACRCALAIKHAVIELQRKLEEEGLPSPKIGIGIDSGHVVAGNLGAPGIKLDYTVIGESVGMSEKLVDCARDPNALGAQIVVSERTKALIEGKFELKDLPALEMPGRASLKIYDLLSELGHGQAPA